MQQNLFHSEQSWSQFLNFRAHELYTINGNKISETFVKWDKEKKKCLAGL